MSAAPFALPPDLATASLRQRLRAFLLSRVGRPEVADDLVQDTLLKAGRALARGPIGNVEGWLFRIARNVANDHFRAQRATVEWQDEAHGGTDDETPVTREESELRESLNEYVRGVVEGLPEPHRTALVLTEYEGLSQVALAARLGLTVSAAKSRVQRARAEVRRVVEACCRITTDAYGGVTECEGRSDKSCTC